MQTEAIKHIRIIVRQKTAPEQIVDLVGEVVACLTYVDAFETRLRGSRVTGAAFGLHSVLSGREVEEPRTAPYLAGCLAKVQAPVLQIQFESLGWPLPRRRQVINIADYCDQSGASALRFYNTSMSDRERRAARAAP
jgi:hypothetical protein